MIKDVVVNLSVRQHGGAALDYAVSLAATFGAHLAGIAFVYDPIVPVSGAGYIPADVIDRQQADSEAAAQAVIRRFDAAVARAGLSAETQTLGASFAGAGDQFGRVARRFDLAVLDQAEADSNAVEELIAETTLFESGRPVIVVPYIHRAPFKRDRVMVCWDGSRPAARAIGDSIPLLAKDSAVELVIVADERGKETEIAGADLGEHLARHGLEVAVERLATGGVDIGDALLSHAADTGADLLVMGGYGHSRLRQFVLGGVTSTILRSMTVPVLMAH